LSGFENGVDELQNAAAELDATGIGTAPTAATQPVQATGPDILGAPRLPSWLSSGSNGEASWLGARGVTVAAGLILFIVGLTQLRAVGQAVRTARKGAETVGLL
jgi:hypothetical protein